MDDGTLDGQELESSDEAAQKYLESLKTDFRNFLFYVWHFLALPDPTPLQYEVANYLQYGPTRQIIEAYRGFGKSWVTSGYVVWGLWNDPDDKYLVVSASKQRADDFTNFTKRLISDIPFLMHLKAKEYQRDSTVAFDVGPARPAHAPSVKSVGVFGQMTGSRANHIIFDDAEVPNNSGTVEMRERLLRAVLEGEAITVPGARITYLGTPQTEESIYNKLRQEHHYKALIWPARYPATVEKYQNELAPSIIEALEANPRLAGKPTDPDHFDDITLLEKEASFGKSEFLLQFMLDTTLADQERYPLKTADLIIFPCRGNEKGPITLGWASSHELVMKELPGMGFTGDRWHRHLFADPRWEPWEGSVMAIDPAGRGTDETGYAVVKHLNGHLYVTQAGGLTGGYEEDTLIQLSKIAAEERVNAVIVEANFGDGMYTRLLGPVMRKYWNCKLEEVKHSIQKEKRIADTLEPVLGRHKLIFDPGIIKADYVQFLKEQKYSLIHQFTRLTRDRGALTKDDRLDALSIGVSYWVESMGRNIEDTANSYKEAAMAKELEGFMSHCLGSETAKKGNKWVQVAR